MCAASQLAIRLRLSAPLPSAKHLDEAARAGSESDILHVGEGVAVEVNQGHDNIILAPVEIECTVFTSG